MNSKGKGIITAVIVVLIALAAFCGFGYISQRMTASEGITYLDKKEYQKAYEQFDHAAGKFTLIFTKQKKDVLFYEGEALYQMGEYGKAIEIYDQLIDHGESRAYSLKAYCLAQQKKLNKFSFLIQAKPSYIFLSLFCNIESRTLSLCDISTFIDKSCIDTHFFVLLFIGYLIRCFPSIFGCFFAFWHDLILCL